VTDQLRQPDVSSSDTTGQPIWMPDRWLPTLKSHAVSLWAGVAAIVVLAAGATLLLLQGTTPTYVWFGWTLAGVSVLLACFQSWRLGLRWATRNARKALIESLSDSDEALFLTETNGRVIYDTDAFRALIRNVNWDDLLGFANLASLGELISPTSSQNFLRMKAQAADGRRDASEVEIKVSGERHYWRVSVEPVGTLKGLSLWTFVDVTAQRQFEARREGEQQFLNDLLDELPVGFFSAAQDGTLQYINKTLASWLHVEQRGGEENNQPSLADFVVVGEGKDDVPDVEMDESGMHGGVRLQSQEGDQFSAYLIQSQRENSAGEFQYSRSLVLREPFTPVVDDGTGGPLLRRIPWLFSDSPVGIVLLDMQGTVVDCNRSFLKILGLHRDGVVGWPISERISKEDRDSADTALTKVVMGIMPATLLEVRVPAGGERELTTSFYVSRMEDSSGEVTGLVLHVIDTTEQKNLEVQFNQAQKMQAVGQLAGGVAHDFNNLLTAMGGFCDLLLSRHGPDDPDFADIMQIKQNANRAANLVRQLLAFSRRQTLQPKIFSITDALNDLSNLLRRLIGENIELDIVHGEDVDLIRTDPGQFDQVIINLAVNARDAMPGGGTITVSTDQVEVETAVQRGHDVMPAGNYIRINVADTGSGIAQEDISRIFEPFFSTKDVGEGTGLGLSTVYGIVRQSDGYIFVDSALGEGTSFSIYLPAYSAAEATAFGGEISQIGGVEVAEEKDLTGEATVLLVEDEDAVRVFGSRALTNKGYRVLEAIDGEQALDVINDFGNPIDLIITDVMMPGMDGHTLVRLVQEELPDIKVILMSGYAEDAIPGEIAGDASINFLPKPFSLQELAGKVKDVMAS